MGKFRTIDSFLKKKNGNGNSENIYIYMAPQRKIYDPAIDDK